MFPERVRIVRDEKLIEPIEPRELAYSFVCLNFVIIQKLIPKKLEDQQHVRSCLDEE